MGILNHALVYTKTSKSTKFLSSAAGRTRKTSLHSFHIRSDYDDDSERWKLLRDYRREGNYCHNKDQS